MAFGARVRAVASVCERLQALSGRRFTMASVRIAPITKKDLDEARKRGEASGRIGILGSSSCSSCGMARWPELRFRRFPLIDVDIYVRVFLLISTVRRFCGERASWRKAFLRGMGCSSGFLECAPRHHYALLFASVGKSVNSVWRVAWQESRTRLMT